MKFLKSVFLKIAVVIIFFWLSGCTYTQTYIPELNDKQSAIIDSINSKI